MVKQIWLTSGALTITSMTPPVKHAGYSGALGATTVRLGQQPPGTEVHLVPPLPVWVLLSPPSVG